MILADCITMPCRQTWQMLVNVTSRLAGAPMNSSPQNVRTWLKAEKASFIGGVLRGNTIRGNRPERF